MTAHLFMSGGTGRACTHVMKQVGEILAAFDLSGAIA